VSGTSSRIPGWGKVRKKWRGKNPPDENGYYTCAICKKPVHEDKLSLDHIAPAALYPEYAKELSNLRPTHTFCNQEREFSNLKYLKGRKILGISKQPRRK
jgi:5-methylcytosine-specific restriction endonuclease McrA